jgi:carboxymethylenebutenolidase
MTTSPDSTNPHQNVKFASNGGQAFGYLKRPAGGSGPGLIVIQEWWGLDDHVADVVDRFAAEGFVTLAPDLYGGRVAHDADNAGAMMAALDSDHAVQDLSGAVDFLLADDSVTSAKVGAVGFCMGGDFVLKLAAAQGDRIGAAVPYYGLADTTPGRFAAITAPIQGHYGEQDGFYPVEQAHVLEQQLSTDTSGPVEFFYYPAGHAFNNDKDRLGTYDAQASAQAWARTVAFLHEQLG